MKRRIRSCIALIVLATSIQAQEWIDITSSYVTNPDFDGSINGWTDEFGSAAQNHGYQNASYTNGDITISQFAEAWRETWDWQTWSRQLLGDASIYQQLTSLPSGKFRLEADAIANDQAGENNPVTGVLLFMESATNLATATMATGNGQPEHFSVEMTDYSGSITIGVRTKSATANWLAFDNVRLYLWGTIVAPTKITLKESGATLQLGETFQLQPTVVPSNATYKRVTYHSDNESVATVDENGLITGIGTGQTRVHVSIAESDYSSIEAKCFVTVKGGEATAGSLLVNEVQQANIDQFIDPSWNFGGWIELYNTTDSNISLAGLYLSDDPANPRKMPLDSRFGIVPAKGFKTIWFDHYSRYAPMMVNFKLDCDGGTVCLAKDDGTVILQQDYPPAIARTSYARTTDGGTAWSYTEQPTPGATNATSKFAVIRLAAPVVDHDGGFFTASFTARVTIPAGTTLRYTTDGSTPTLTNGQTSTNGRFDISETTILRLRLFKDGQLSSPVVTRSYIYKDKNYTLPVVSLVSDNANLYGDDYGIFVRGNGNGRPGNGQNSACNWNMDWDRPANIEFFTEDGTAAFNQEVGIEAAGGWSRAWSPHSFNIKANKVYEGVNRMNYPFFENKPYLRHKALKVRNGGNDYNGGRIKDAAIQEVVRTSGLYVETQSYKPVHVFHNGSYIGVENLREPNNKNYAYANYGIDTDEQDQWKMSPDSGYVQQKGTREAWDELVTLSYNATDPVTYNMISDRLDIEEYINYCAVELYIAGTDWPKNNIKAFRDNVNGGSNARFRFVLFDTDGAFATDNSFSWFERCNWWTFDQLYGDEVIAQYGNRIYGEIVFVTLLRNLWQNETFKKQFADQFCIVAGSVFEPTRAAEVINAMVSHVNSAMELEWKSASSASSVKNNLNASRQTSAVRNMRNYLGLGESTKLTLSSDLSEARLQINGLEIPTGKFAGQVFKPVTVKATAPAGYAFAGWVSNISAESKTLFGKGTTWDYYDQGSLDGEQWTSISYSNHWSTGKAPLGYDTGNASKAAAYGTTLSYGGNASNKYPTYYFRKQINLAAAPKASDTFTLDWVADDGFVVYVNGTEAGRFLMDKTPSPTFNSLADTYANANPESGQTALDASLFRKGSNLIAVELHNNSKSSTDIYWDAALLQATEVAGSYVSTNEEYTLPATTTGDITLKASYTRLNGSDKRAWDAHPVKINEVSAANDIYASDIFKKSDWIELYNTTDTDYDVAGMYLSDHLSQPEKWQIPVSNGTYSTIIPAHGHLVVWCDKTASGAQLHADFKLNNEDKSLVLLTAKDKSWADTLVYCRHDGFHTVGLYPDGGSSLYVMERPTIGQTNVLTTTAALWPEPEPDIEVGIDAAVEDGEWQLAYVGDALLLHATAPSARLDIYSTNGQLMLTRRIAPETAVGLSALPAGIYVAYATAGDQQATLKFIRQ